MKLSAFGTVTSILWAAKGVPAVGAEPAQITAALRSVSDKIGPLVNRAADQDGRVPLKLEDVGALVLAKTELSSALRGVNTLRDDPHLIAQSSVGAGELTLGEREMRNALFRLGDFIAAVDPAQASFHTVNAGSHLREAHTSLVTAVHQLGG